MSITQDDLLDALRSAIAHPEGGDGFTGPELAEQLKTSATTVRKRLKQLLQSGELELVTVTRKSITGKSLPIIGYRKKS